MLYKREVNIKLTVVGLRNSTQINNDRQKQKHFLYIQSQKVTSVPGTVPQTNVTSSSPMTSAPSSLVHDFILTVSAFASTSLTVVSVAVTVN